MTPTTGRADRRRRMLNDGRLAGEALSGEDSGPRDDAGRAPRYAPDASSVSFGLVRRVLPTGAWSLAGVATAALAATAAVAAGDRYQDAIVARLGEPARSLFEASSPTSLASWLAVSLALAVGVLSGVVFGLRRHRSDDLRGVYRWWMGASLVAMAASLCLATGLHQIAASAIAGRVGWSPLPNDAFWWAAPTLLLAGAVAVRAVLDLKESRIATAAAVLATVAAGVSFAAAMGWAPAAAAGYLEVASVAALHAGLWSAVFALLAYARRIALEASGKVAVPAKRRVTRTETEQAGDSDQPPKKQRASASTPKAEPASKAAPPSRREAAPAPTPTAKSKPQAAKIEWVDGSQGDPDDAYDDGSQGGRRKLTKAERKRLRRQKARNAA